MNEWLVFITLGEILVFFVAIITPMLKLNTTIVKLNDAIDRLDKAFDSLSDKNDESHNRMWKKIDHHEEVIQDHERRLVVFEKMEERK